MMALVLEVILTSMRWGLMLRSSRVSTKTGVAPVAITAEAVAKKEFGGMITSSPEPYHKFLGLEKERLFPS